MVCSRPLGQYTKILSLAKQVSQASMLYLELNDCFSNTSLNLWKHGVYDNQNEDIIPLRSISGSAVRTEVTIDQTPYWATILLC